MAQVGSEAKNSLTKLVPLHEVLIPCLGVDGWEHLTNTPWIMHVFSSSLFNSSHV